MTTVMNDAAWTIHQRQHTEALKGAVAAVTDERLLEIVQADIPRDHYPSLPDFDDVRDEINGCPWGGAYVWANLGERVKAMTSVTG